MPLHIIKLSVGTDSIDDLADWIAGRRAARRGADRNVHLHRTRMIPKRVEELLDGGSLYWIIKGFVAARQKLLEIRPTTDEAGIARCYFVMDPELIPVLPRPHRPFQGWRYLRPEDAPADLTGRRAEVADMPENLRRELSEMGLL